MSRINKFVLTVSLLIFIMISAVACGIYTQMVKERVYGLKQSVIDTAFAVANIAEYRRSVAIDLINTLNPTEEQLLVGLRTAYADSLSPSYLYDVGPYLISSDECIQVKEFEKNYCADIMQVVKYRHVKNTGFISFDGKTFVYYLYPVTHNRSLIFLLGLELATNQDLPSETFDLAVIATGHVWPDEEEATRTYFPSPWSGLMEAKVDACNVGIMGTSLSGLDAAMAVAIQHGSFIEDDKQHVVFHRDNASEKLNITLMSRTGILPEADFYCPIPYEPLHTVTDQALNAEIQKGEYGLLDRVFRLIVEEIKFADPGWSQRIALESLNVDSFAQAWFAERKQRDPFDWAEKNLQEVERNKREKHTVPWRYVILRLHEAVQEIVPHLNEHDHKRFSKGLARVFIDNYAAIPSESIRRLLALREAGIIHILALGEDYEMEINESRTVLKTEDNSYSFDVFIDARGQRPLKVKDIPFPGLREQLQKTGDEIPDVGEDYTLQQPEEIRGRVAFGALPWLMHDQPFVQGLTACAEIGEAMARAVVKPASRARKRLSFD